MSLANQIKAMPNVNPQDKEMVLGLVQAYREAMVIPNSAIPDAFHKVKGYETGNLRKADTHVFGPTVADIDKKWKKLYGKKEERKSRKDQKDERVTAYAAQYAAQGSFEFRPDADKLYRNEATFCHLMGLIETDDLLE